uniref:Uncharacterized protein n=1 Tax=Oryza meridionalis TaxID=40149 RepID=A0A0E0DMJ4_9ORYZ
MVARVRRHGPDETRREVGRPICFESRGSRPKPKPTRTRGKRRQFRDSGEGGGAGETANASPAVRPAGGAAVREEMREGERDGVRGGDSPAATGARYQCLRACRGKNLLSVSGWKKPSANLPLRETSF